MPRRKVIAAAQTQEQPVTERLNGNRVESALNAIRKLTLGDLEEMQKEEAMGLVSLVVKEK